MATTDKLFADIEALPSAQAGKILGSEKLVLAEKIARSFAIGFFVCLILAPFVIYFSLTTELQQVTKTFLTIIGCIIVTLFLLFPLVLNQKNRWLWRIARKEIAGRTDKIVDPYSPAVRFVEVVPKGNWRGESLVDESAAENAVDIGFLALDYTNGLLLFEGDNERYRIPAQTIVKCEQDYYSRWKYRPTPPFGGSKYEVRYFFVVVTVRLSEQSFEIPFRIRFGKKLSTQEQRCSANFALLKEINKMQRGLQM